MAKAKKNTKRTKKTSVHLLQPMKGHLPPQIFNHVILRWLREMLNATDDEMKNGRESDDREFIYLGPNFPDPNHNYANLLRVEPVFLRQVIERMRQNETATDAEYWEHPKSLFETLYQQAKRKYKAVTKNWPTGPDALRFYRWDWETEKLWNGGQPTQPPKIPSLHY